MYTLRWRSEALDELADLWIAATPELRERIYPAMRAFNASLQVAPYRQSESRAGIERIGFPDPLVVFYEVDEQSGTVTVKHVKLKRSRV